MTGVKQHVTLMNTALQLLTFVSYVIVQIIIRIVHKLTPLAWQPRKNVAGQVALITGAGSGIGQLTAVKLASMGVKCVIWDINATGVKETVERIEKDGGYAKGYVCDLTKREQVYEKAAQTEKEVGEVSILINNAGFVAGNNLLDTPDELIKRTFDVNILAHFWTTKSFLPGMMKRKNGHIVTIASLAGLSGTPNLIDYSSSKFAAVGFDESLRLELDSQGYTAIHTSCICPFFIQSTGMFKNVNSPIFSRLDGEEVAENVVLAILYNRQTVILPSFFNVIILFKMIFPATVFSYVVSLICPNASYSSAKPTETPKIANNSAFNVTKPLAQNAIVDNHSL